MHIHVLHVTIMINTKFLKCEGCSKDVVGTYCEPARNRKDVRTQYSLLESGMNVLEAWYGRSENKSEEEVKTQ